MPEENPELNEIKNLMLELKKSVLELKADQKATESKVDVIYDCIPPQPEPQPIPEPPPPPPEWALGPYTGQPYPGRVTPYPGGRSGYFYRRLPSECCRICDVAGSFVITHCSVSRIGTLQICGLAGKDLANQEVEIFEVRGFCNMKRIGRGKTDAEGKFGFEIEDTSLQKGQILIVRINGDVACTKVLPR